MTNNTHAIINLLSDKEITVKQATKELEHLGLNYRTIYRVFRSHGKLIQKGCFVKKEEKLNCNPDANQSSSILAAATNNKAA